jgi:hypothetical protein
MARWTTKKKRWFGVCAGVAALAGALVGWLFLSPSTAPAFLASLRSTSHDIAPANMAMAKVKKSINNSQKTAVAQHTLGDHALPSALNFSSPEDFRPNAHWFDAAERSADGKFASNHTPLRFDASCASYPQAKHATFEAAIAREVEFDPAQATPADVQVQELAQFWRIGDNFYKLAGTWERDQPATFRTQLFAATSADFEQGLRVMPLPEGLPAQTDVLTLGETMDREIERATAIGGTRGARLVQVFYPNSDGKASEVKLHNGRPMSWVFGHGRCQLREQGNAYCRCIAPDLHEKTHSHDQQSAGQPPSKQKETPYRVHD